MKPGFVLKIILLFYLIIIKLSPACVCYIYKRRLFFVMIEKKRIQELIDHLDYQYDYNAQTHDLSLKGYVLATKELMEKCLDANNVGYTEYPIEEIEEVLNGKNGITPEQAIECIKDIKRELLLLLEKEEAPARKASNKTHFFLTIALLQLLATWVFLIILFSFTHESQSKANRQVLYRIDSLNRIVHQKIDSIETKTFVAKNVTCLKIIDQCE